MFGLRRLLEGCSRFDLNKFLPIDIMPTQYNREIIRAIEVEGVGKRVVFVSGNFNILHPGHLRLLRFAHECGDYLVVGVLDDSSPGAFVDETIRLEGIRAIQWVDQAFVLYDRPEAFIAQLKPPIVVKGSEHEQMYNVEEDVIKGYGGQLLFCSGDTSFSSIDLLHKELHELNLSTIKLPYDYQNRHSIKPSRCLEILDRMKGLKVCVVGDTIIDEYITCDPLGMSQEDPTIVVTPILQEKFIGGAAIVAAHARSLGCSVQFLTVLGDDETGEFAREGIKGYGVDGNIFIDESRPTTLKQRFRAGNKTLLRVSHLRQHDINKELRTKFLDKMKYIINDIDMLIFSDFNYGCLPQSLVIELISLGRAHGVMMAADSQSSSQLGDVSRFKDMALITPTEREARLALQDFDSGLAVLAESLRKNANADNVAITLGDEGVLIQTSVNETNLIPTDRIPALNRMPKDVAGAGDSFLTCAAMALAVGADIWHASYLGSLAAASQVGRVGNIPLTYGEIAKEIMA